MIIILTPDASEGYTFAEGPNDTRDAINALKNRKELELALLYLAAINKQQFRDAVNWTISKRE